MGKILVAGGTGFLGRSLVRELDRRDESVAVLTRRAASDASLPDGVEWRQGDVTRPETLPDAMSEIDTAVLAVQFQGYPIEAPGLGRTFMDVDALGTAALVEAAGTAGVRKLVYVSGVGADAASTRVWYRAKGRAEASVQTFGGTWAIVRPSWVYGPEDTSLNRFVDLIRYVPFFFPQLGSGSQRLTPVHIDDVVELLCAVTLGTAGDERLIEVGGPQVVTMDDIVSTAMRVLGRRKPIIHIPTRLAKLGAALLELLPGQILSRGAVDFVTQDGVADARTLGPGLAHFRPRDFESGLRSYLGSD